MNLSTNKTISSREISELTNKPHNDVLKAIRNMEKAWVKVTGGKFSLSEYTDTTGRNLPMFLLDKRECLFIATKFNDEARAKLVMRWEELETSKIDFTNPDTVLQLAQNWKNEQIKRLEAESKVEYLEPKAQAFNHMMEAEGEHPLDEVAKNLNTGRTRLINFLKTNRIFFLDRPIPLQKYIDNKWFVVKTAICNDGKYRPQTFVTHRGMNQIHDLMFGKPIEQLRIA